MNEWKNEPDSKEFTASGLHCEIKRHPRLLHLCGYVDVPKGHALYGKGYSELYEAGVDIDVHGGLTYAEAERDSWRFGFDCAHLYDLVPSQLEYGEYSPNDVYRNMAYVEKETRNLAKQLKALQKAEAVK